MIIGKALSGGFYPVSAVLTGRSMLGLFRPGDHGSTFGGNPLGAAVARAALAVLVDEEMVARSAELGAYFKGRLERIESQHIKEVRGKGLFIGVELKVPARRFCEALEARGCSAKRRTRTSSALRRRWSSPAKQIDWALEQH